LQDELSHFLQAAMAHSALALQLVLALLHVEDEMVLAVALL
jgi:hypothetical protein